MAMSKMGRAWKLVNDVVTGPNGVGYEDAREGQMYRLWVSTWVLPSLKELIPQLATLKFHHCTNLKQSILAIPGYTDNTCKLPSEIAATTFGLDAGEIRELMMACAQALLDEGISRTKIVNGFIHDIDAIVGQRNRDKVKR